MKKILIFSLAYYPKHVGGAEVAIKNITDRIDSSDIEFHMVTLRFDSSLPKVEKVGNILVHRIGFTKKNPTIADLRKFPLHLNKFYYQFAAFLKAASLHKKYKYDGIWAMMAHSTGVPAGLFKTRYSKVPYLLTLQEGDPFDSIKKTMLPIYPLFVRGFTKADFVQAISTYLAKWAKEMGFSGPMKIIPNAVNTEYFSKKYPESKLNVVKQKLEKKQNDIFLITTSRLVKKNAVDDVIKSLKYLPKTIKFLVLGSGPDEIMLKDLAKSEGVGGRVLFLGQINNDELPLYLHISDIFIRPSRSEGMGNSFVEAMAAGLPVIGTQEGGIADFLFDRDINPDKKPTGFAVPVNDPQTIADQVTNILNNLEKTKETIENARELAFQKYDWNLIASDMKEKVFNKILG